MSNKVVAVQTSVSGEETSLTNPHSSFITSRNSVPLIGDMRGFKTSIDKFGTNVVYKDVINFTRKKCATTDHHCVMCGNKGNVIPSQNKDVCKDCDSVIWHNSKLDVLFKFCKGCKVFFVLEDFKEKPFASKCNKCRQRGRTNYLAKKEISPSYDETSHPLKFPRYFESFDPRNSLLLRPPIIPRTSWSNNSAAIVTPSDSTPRLKRKAGHDSYDSPDQQWDTMERAQFILPPIKRVSYFSSENKENYSDNGLVEAAVPAANDPLNDSCVSDATDGTDKETVLVSPEISRDNSIQRIPSTRDNSVKNWQWDPAIDPLMNLAMLTETHQTR